MATPFTNDSGSSPGQAVFADIEPRHYDRVPSIIDHLTYIVEAADEQTGEIHYERRRLTPTEKELYRILRYRAGSGACWRDTRDLADHVGCSPTTIVEAKKALASPFEQLGGDPLIYIQEKRVRTLEGEKTINRKTVHLITIAGIWRYNNAFMDGLDQKDIHFPKRKAAITAREAEIALEKMRQPSVVECVHNLGAHTKTDTSPKAHTKSGTSPLGGSYQNCYVNKDNEDKDHCLKTDPTAEAVARMCLTDIDVEDCFVSEAKTCDWLQCFGFNLKKVDELFNRYSRDQFKLATLYLRKILDNGKPIKSLTGYFLLVLEKRWYMPKPS